MSRAGVNNHSNFAYRPIDRLRTTMSYVYTMAFGTPAEKRTIIGMVHRAHAPVEGVSDADAKVGAVQYNANDPELQLWVAATLYAAGVDIYEKVRSFLLFPFQSSSLLPLLTAADLWQIRPSNLGANLQGVFGTGHELESAA